MSFLIRFSITNSNLFGCDCAFKNMSTNLFYKCYVLLSFDFLGMKSCRKSAQWFHIWGFQLMQILDLTQHADAQHEGVHPVGHHSGASSGWARRRHHFLRLSFLTLNLKQHKGMTKTQNTRVTNSHNHSTSWHKQSIRWHHFIIVFISRRSRERTSNIIFNQRLKQAGIALDFATENINISVTFFSRSQEKYVLISGKQRICVWHKLKM